MNAAGPDGPSRIFVGIGSNIEPERNVRDALRRLRAAFGKVAVSPVYRSAPVGFDGEPFLNLVASFDTGLAPRDVVAELDRIEARAGRRRDGARFAARTLDIDLLLHGDLVVDEPGLRLPRDDILEYAFVLAPLADLAPDLVHPTAGATMRELWSAFDRPDQPLERVDAAAD